MALSRITEAVASFTDLTIGDDLTLTDDFLMASDASIIKFGADADVTLTHVHNTGLLLNSTSVIQFNDSSQNIGAPNATTLDINATDEIELNATLVDVNANLDVSGTYTGAGLMTTGGNIVIPDAGNIGSASDTDAIAISSGGVVTFSQNPVFPDGGISIADLDIDGGTDIGGAIADADLFVIDDGAGGANRKTAASRIKTYVGASAGGFSIDNLDIDGGTDIGEAIVDADLFIIDNGAGGTNRKVAASRIKTYIGSLSAAADDITAGDAAVNLTTTSGNITIDAQGNDTDIIFKGTDNSSDITMLTLDGSEAGEATFNAGIVIADAGNIGSASDKDAIAIASNGQVTFTQTLIGTALDISGDIDVDGTTNLDVVDIDGAVDMASTLTVAGALSAKGGAVFNEDSADVDFRVESNGEANMLLVDGGNDRVVMSKSSSGATTFPLVLTNPPDNNANTAVGLRFVPSNATIGDRTVDIVGSQSSSGGNAMELKILTSNGGTATERMRINSSGHFLFGTTTDGTTAVGTVIRDAGEVLITRASNPPLLVNRTTDSGDIIEIRHDNTRIGGIQQRFGSIQVGSSDTNLIFNSGASEIAPSSNSGGTNDSVLTLGANNRRFKNFYMNGTIFNEKTTYALENTEGMVIDDSAQIIMESDNGVLLRLNRMNGNGHGLQFYRGSTNQVGSISFNTSSTTFNTSSDYRLKENVSYDFDATSRLKKLKPARFNFIAEKDITVDGFLAHEVSDIVPEAVSGEKDAMTKEVLYVEGEPIPDGKKVGDVKEASQIDPQGIDQAKLVPLLVKTVQELEARIKTLEDA